MKENFKLNNINFNELNEKTDNKILRNNIFNINKEIDFRNNEEKLGRWKDRDLLIFRKDFGLPDRARKAKVPQVEILPGTFEALSSFMGKEPQWDLQDRFRYLLTSGLAVEAITGAGRYHHDIDLVLFDFRNNWWTKYATDNVTSDRYWADMKFDPAYLEETAWTAQFQTNGVEQTVSTVHPAIILVQKLSNAWGRPPRERDLKDVKQLSRYWREVQDSDPSWLAITEVALAALPPNERARTITRLNRSRITRPVTNGLATKFLLRLGFN